MLLHVLTYTKNEFVTDLFIHESGWYMHNVEDLNNDVITCAESFDISTIHIFTLVKLPYCFQLTLKSVRPFHRTLSTSQMFRP